MTTFKTIQLSLAVALPLLAASANASNTTDIFNLEAPGIVAPSHPYFLDTDGSVSIKKMGSGSNAYWQMTGKGSATSFWGPDTSYNLKNEKFKYVANFDANGNLITSIGNKDLENFLEIKGALPAGHIGGTSWGRLSNQLLLRADLLQSGVDDSGTAIGFKTLFTGGWAATNPGLTGGSIGESLWLFSDNHDDDDFKDLVNALDGIKSNGTLRSLIDKSKKIERINAVASVPVPGAVWLFATGLAALVAGRRKASA